VFGLCDDRFVRTVAVTDSRLWREDWQVSACRPKT
jgi:hypothetical protein